MKVSRCLWIAIALCGVWAPSHAQGVDGYVSAMLDVFPQLTPRATELRTRVFTEKTLEPGWHLRFTGSGFLEALLADRRPGEWTKAAIVRAQELHAEWLGSRADVRAGFSRIVWGRLDEFLPTDVVNPLDVTKFFLEGRAEARLPVAVIRGRVLPTDRFTVEGIYVPIFRRGRFDELDEDTAPFTVAAGVPTVSREPARSWSDAQGGVRASVTSGRVDWAVSAYRGFEHLPLYQVSPSGLEEQFPRFTMIGGDFETVRGEWGLRGELAAFVERTLQVPDQPLTVEGHAIEMGLGLDRRAGNYRVSTNVVVSHRAADALPALDDTDTNVVLSVDRSFARETRHVRTFAVFNPNDESAFARLIASFNVRDDVTVEASGGLFSGGGTDTLSRLADRDFVYLRLKVFF